MLGATNTVVSTTKDLLVSAAKHTPGINQAIKKRVHIGFWAAYSVVRMFVHSTLRKELRLNPGPVFFTGHSLGGALATLAALDFEMHSKPRINRYLKYEQRYELSSICNMNIDNIFDTIMNVYSKRVIVESSKKVLVTTTMYNFGSPKVGNWAFAEHYDKIVPDSFRIVVDGDLVSAVPPTTDYAHIGTQVIVDSIGAGSIIIDPSFVETHLHTSIKTSVSVHSLNGTNIVLTPLQIY